MTSIDARPMVVSTTETLPRKRLRRGAVLALACAATAMVGLDVAIVNVALPSIQRDLGVAQHALQWVVVAYGLLLGGFLLVGGRMTDRLGRRRIFMLGLAIFAAASLFAGSATGAGMLIGARAVQGFGAALIVPAALSLLVVTFAEGRERDWALGIFGAVGGAAGTVGVVASGLLAGGPGWRWAFLINVPAGVLLMVVAAVFLVADRVTDRTTRLDVAGAATVTGALLVFVYALHHAGSHGWGEPSTLALFAMAIALLAAFVRVEARSAAPLVPRAMLRNRTLIAANVTTFLAFSALFSFIFIGSLLMQQALGYSPIKTGLAWLATTATILPAAMAGGRLIARVGVRPLLIAGLASAALGALMLTSVSAGAGYLTGILPAFLLAGIGFGLCGPALQIGALSGVSSDDAGLASGLVETMSEIGGAAGVAAASAVLVSGAGLDGFHAAFALIAVLAITGLGTAALGLRARTTRPRWE